MSYTSYRQLDELWLITIPKHWDNRKIKYAFSERVEKGFPDEQLLVASQNMGVVPKSVYGSRTVEATKDLHNLKLVRVGDFVISLRSFQGGLEYAYYQGIISPAYTVMIPNELIISGYFRFLAKSRLFIELLQMCVTGIREGQNIDYNKLKNHTIPIPPLPEQDQIVRYLDWKVSGIDKFIKLIYGKPSIDPKVLEGFPESLLARLIEYRTRLISDVVTGKMDVRRVAVPQYEAVEVVGEDEVDEDAEGEE
jgi:type I restriction enzyme S subunit